MHRLRLAVICLLLTLGSAGAASAAVHASLTRAEYQQLRQAQKRITSLATTDTHNLKRDRAVCTHIRPVSTLIGGVRSGCLALVRLGGDYDRLNARATRCGINPDSAAAILTCLVPAVQRYHTDARAFYRAQARVDRIARRRGFGARCVAVIAGSPGNLAAERQLADQLGRAVKALQNQDPSALQTLTAQIQAAAKAIRPGPRSLSLCPHR